MCATSKQPRRTICLTSYHPGQHSADPLDTIKIWEACHATLATTSFFNPICIGPLEEFVDGPLEANNPVYALWTQAENVWGGQLRGRLHCLVSIGTGVPTPIPTRDVGIWATLKALATETARIAEQFRHDRSSLDDDERYYRFNVDRGLENIGLEESKNREKIAAAVARYIASGAVSKQLRACASCYAATCQSQGTSGLEESPRMASRESRICWA